LSCTRLKLLYLRGMCIFNHNFPLLVIIFKCLLSKKHSIVLSIARGKLRQVILVNIQCTSLFKISKISRFNFLMQDSCFTSIRDGEGVGETRATLGLMGSSKTLSEVPSSSSPPDPEAAAPDEVAPLEDASARSFSQTLRKVRRALLLRFTPIS
jgi:hypothetical protein